MRDPSTFSDVQMRMWWSTHLYWPHCWHTPDFHSGLCLKCNIILEVRQIGCQALYQLWAVYVYQSTLQYVMPYYLALSEGQLSSDDGCEYVIGHSAILCCWCHFLNYERLSTLSVQFANCSMGSIAWRSVTRQMLWLSAQRLCNG